MKLIRYLKEYSETALYTYLEMINECGLGREGERDPRSAPLQVPLLRAASHWRGLEAPLRSNPSEVR